MSRTAITRNIFLLGLLLSLLSSTAPTVHAQAWKTSADAPAWNAPASPQKWDDRSDELPGMSSAKPFLVAGAVVTGALATALIVRSRKNKKERESTYRAQPDSASGLTSAGRDLRLHNPESETLLESIQQSARQMPVNVFIGMGHEGPIASDRALVVGAAVRF